MCARDEATNVFHSSLFFWLQPGQTTAIISIRETRIPLTPYPPWCILVPISNRRYSFKYGRRKGGWNDSRSIRIIRFSASCSPRHVSTTWKKIDRPINRNRAAPPLFYRIIERMSQRSLTRPSPSDLPYSRFRSEIIRNRKRERGRQRDEDEDEAWAKSHRSHHATE